MATKVFPTANDVNGGVAGQGKTAYEANLVAWLKALTATDFVITGLTVPANSANLNLNVALGQAMLRGYWVTKDAQETVVCTNAATNYIYLALTRDGGGNVTAANLVVNTTGVPPADSMLLATAVAAGGLVTSTTDQRVTKFAAAAVLSGAGGTTLIWLKVSAGMLQFSADGGGTWTTLNPMTTAQDIIVGGVAGAPGRLAMGPANTFLSSDGVTLAYRTALQSGFAIGVTSTPTTTSTSFVDLTDMSVTLTTTGGKLIAFFWGVLYDNTISNVQVYVGLSLDGAAEVGIVGTGQDTASYLINEATGYQWTGVSAGSHTVKARWKVGSGSANAFTTMRYLLVMEVRG